MKSKFLQNRAHRSSGLSRLLFILSVLFTVTISGCASAVKESRPAYKEVLNSWTRAEKIYDGIDLRLSVTATYKNREFRSSYVDNYIDAYRLEKGAKEAMLTREADESDRYNEFFISVNAPDKSLNDLDSKDSVWRLYLEDATGVSLAPVSVKRGTSGALISAFYPYVDVWSVGYIVRFPKYSASGSEPIPNEKSKFLRLAIVGLLGNGQLTWKLDK